MRTFIKTAAIASVTGAALVLAAVPANAAPEDYDYARGSLGASCSGHPQGKLALDTGQGFVLTCTPAGTWQIPSSSKP